MQFKPYPEYKDSGVEWLGEVPAQWNVVPIKAISRLITNKTSGKENVIALEHIESGTGKLINSDSEFSSDAIQFEVSDILFGKLRPYLAKVYLAERSGQAIGDLYVFRPNKKINPILFKHLLLSSTFIDYVNSSVNGTKMPRTNWDFMGAAKIGLPSAKAQVSIASFLDQETTKIDLLISKQEKLIELLEEQRKSIISHAVTKGLNPDAPMKDSGVEWLGKVPAHWSAIPIKYLANINTEVLAESTDYNYDIQYVDISGVSEKEGISHRETVEFGNAPSRARRIVKDGDIIISTVRTYLRAIAYIKNPPSNMIVSTGFAVITPLRKILSSQFAKYAFLADAFLDEVISKSKGVSYPAITTTELADIAIMVPNLIEQTEIAKYLDQEISKIDTTIDKQKQLVENLKEYRSSIISHAVTGKVDVRDLAA